MLKDKKKVKIMEMGGLAPTMASAVSSTHKVVNWSSVASQEALNI